MKGNVVLFYLLINAFVLFRYVRANRSIVMFVSGFLFLGLALYEARNSGRYFFLFVGLAVLELYIAFLKEKKAPLILKLQAGYKPFETVLHFAIFLIISFLSFLLLRLLV